MLTVKKSVSVGSVGILASFALTAMPATADTLVADGTAVVTVDGSSFAWANRPSGATVGQTHRDGILEFDIAAQPHAPPSNQAALLAKMLMTGSALTPACYSELIYTTDPQDSNTNYGNGLFLRSPANGTNVILYNTSALPSTSIYGVETETDYASGNSNNLVQPAYDSGYPIDQRFYERVCTDGTNLTYFKSQTGTAGSFDQKFSGTLASLGNPTDIGFYEDAEWTSQATNYNGVSHLLHFTVQTGNNPQAAAPNTVATFADEIQNSLFPSAADPIDPTAVPAGWPTSDQANLKNYASFVFGSANPMSPNCSACLINNRTQLDAHFEHNQLDGNAYTNVDTGAKDGYSNPAYVSIFRSYPSGNVHNTTIVNSDALQIKAFCSGFNGLECKKKGQIVSGIIRPETVVQDDTIVEACMIRPSTLAGWLTFWQLGGSYPAAGRTPQFYGSSIYPTDVTYYLENDGPDGFPLTDGTSAAQNLTPEIPTLTADNATRQSVSDYYRANGGPYTIDTAGGYDTTFDQSTSMHCFQWENVPPVFSDMAHTVVVTPSHIIYSVDGVEYSDKQTNWEGGPQVGWNRVVLATNPSSLSSVMVALQYGPAFTPNADAAMTQANVKGAVAKVFSLRFWKRIGGAHVAPTLPGG